MHLSQFLAPKYVVVSIFLFATLYVHFRGKHRRPILRQIGDHNTLVAPYNVFMYWFSAVPAKPILNVDDFPELRVLRDNWQALRDEALQLMARGQINAGTGRNDFGFNSFYKAGWKRFYLKWYDSPLPSAVANCPVTVSLLEKIPGVNAAMFAVLPHGAKLNPHRDPFAGSLRYHLGLSTPNDDKCRIYIDGQMYSWRDGQDIVFDETYVHSAANDTDMDRVILFCDVERPLRTAVARNINRFISSTLVRAASTQNVPTERVGLLNRIYALTGKVNGHLDLWKKNHRAMFKWSKVALIAAAVYLIYFVW